MLEARCQFSATLERAQSILRGGCDKPLDPWENHGSRFTGVLGPEGFCTVCKEPSAHFINNVVVLRCNSHIHETPTISGFPGSGSGDCRAERAGAGHPGESLEKACGGLLSLTQDSGLSIAPYKSGDLMENPSRRAYQMKMLR